MRERTRQSADHHIATCVQVFAQLRLQDNETLRWASRLSPLQEAERAGIRHAIQFPQREVAEPYRSAWLWVIECWSEPEIDYQFKATEISEAKKRGARPALLVDEIARLVAPRLSIESSDRLFRSSRKSKYVLDLIPGRINGPEMSTLSDFGVRSDVEPSVLTRLIDSLEAGILRGLYWSELLGAPAAWRANWVTCVYPRKRNDGEDSQDRNDVDQFKEGFVAAVKLYSEALECLSSIDMSAARRKHERLQRLAWPLTQRMWAAAARNGALIAGDEVGRWLLSLPDEVFWLTSEHPEIAEVRASRFGDVPPADRKRIEARLRERPPAKLLRRQVDSKRRDETRTRFAIRELSRIEAAGNDLEQKSKAWLRAQPAALLRESRLEEHTGDLYDLRTRFTRGFDGAPYASIDGSALLQRLERDLGSESDLSRHEPFDYISANWSALFDLLTRDSLTNEFPHVLAALASANRDGIPGEQGSAKVKANRVLDQLSMLSQDGLISAADGVCDWLRSWSKNFKTDERFATLWLRVWPVAVAMTNAELDARKASKTESLFGASPSDEEKMASDALNSLVGRLVTAFFDLLPPLGRGATSPFEQPLLARMRQATLEADGEARLQVLFRLISELSYFRRADQDWADRNLFPPLTSADSRGDSRLWDAVSRTRVPSRAVMDQIGQALVQAARQQTISSETRARLAERAVIAYLRDLESNADPFVPGAEIQQMLRLGGDGVRIESAGVLPLFMERPSGDPSQLYKSVVRPFLSDVWPKDRSLLSPGVAKALARLPAAAGRAFSDCVNDIRYFLVPFEVWTLFDYRLYTTTEGGKELLHPSSPEEAAATLVLLDLTIGDAEAGVIPHDLDRALDAIRKQSPSLANDVRYARLATLVRR